MWNYRKGNRILIIIQIFGCHKLVPMLRSGKVWQIWCFAKFLSILLPLSRNLTSSLRTTSYVQESRRWQTFSLFALSELVCTNNYFTLFCYSLYFLTPSFFPFWAFRTDGQISTPPDTLLLFFFHWARGALPAGATLLGWPNYGVDGRLNEQNKQARA